MCRELRLSCLLIETLAFLNSNYLRLNSQMCDSGGLSDGDACDAHAVCDLALFPLNPNFQTLSYATC